MTDDELELLDMLDELDDLLEELIDELLDKPILELETLLLIDELEDAILLKMTDDLLLDDEVITRGGSIPEIKPSLP